MLCANCKASCNSYSTPECSDGDWECIAGINEDDDRAVIDKNEEIVIGCSLTETEIEERIKDYEKSRSDFWSGLCDFLDEKKKITKISNYKEGK